MSKKCTPLQRKIHFQIKIYKISQSRIIYRSQDVERVHAVVVKYISISKSSKYQGFGPFLEVQISVRFVILSSNILDCTILHYNYTPLHSTPLHSTTLHYTTTTSTNTPLHSTTLHYTPLHYTPLHHTTLHYTTLHSTTLQYTTLD